VRPGLKAWLAQLVLPVPKAQLGRRVPQDLKDRQAHKAHKGLLDRVVEEDSLEFRSSRNPVPS
jgi:hypothetical protein